MVETKVNSSPCGKLRNGCGIGIPHYTKRDGIRKPVDLYKELHHPILFQSIKVVNNASMDGR